MRGLWLSLLLMWAHPGGGGGTRSGAARAGRSHGERGRAGGAEHAARGRDGDSRIAAPSLGRPVALRVAGRSVRPQAGYGHRRAVRAGGGLGSGRPLLFQLFGPGLRDLPPGGHSHGHRDRHAPASDSAGVRERLSRGGAGRPAGGHRGRVDRDARQGASDRRSCTIGRNTAQGLADALRREIERRPPRRVVAVETLAQGDKDFTAQVGRVQASRPDVVYFGGIFREAAYLLRQLRQAGVPATFVSGDAVLDPEFVKLAGDDVAAGAYLTFAPDPRLRDSARPVIQRYESRYGTLGPYVLYVYDAVGVLLQCHPDRQADRRQSRRAAQSRASDPGSRLPGSAGDAPLGHAWRPGSVSVRDVRGPAGWQPFRAGSSKCRPPARPPRRNRRSARIRLGSPTRVAEEGDPS